MTDAQIGAQVAYSLGHGWSISIEHSDDPHPRNAYWELFGLPRFDLGPTDADVVMRDVQACRGAFGEHYVKVVAYDASYGRQTTALSFLVNRPTREAGFRLERIDDHDRTMRYRLAREIPAGP